MLWLWCFPVYSPVLLICQMISPEAAPASHSFRLQCIVQQLYKYGNVMGGFRFFIRDRKESCREWNIPGRSIAAAAAARRFADVVEENITKCEIGFPALSAYRFPLFQCVKYIRRAGEGLNALLKEQLWIAANVITSCRRKRWYRSDLSMYYTAAAGETGAIYDPLADESATSRPPPPPPGAWPSSHLLDSSFWNEFLEPIQNKKENQQLSWRVLIKILATITCYRVYI